MQDKLKKSLLLAGIFTMTFALGANGIYKWEDAKGNTQYGDQPPKKSKAHSITLPPLTIVKDYGKQWQPIQFSEDKEAKFSGEGKQEVAPIKSVALYQSLRFIAPKEGQIIDAKNGDVSAMISFKPALKKNHRIIFSVDGKKMSTGRSRMANFSALGAGKHVVFVSIIDKKENIVIKTNGLTFIVKK